MAKGSTTIRNVPVADADARDAHALTATSSLPAVARIAYLDGRPAAAAVRPR